MALNFDTEFRYGIWAWNLSIEFGYGFQIWNLGIELGHEFQVWNSSLLSFKGVRDSGNRIYRPFGLVHKLIASSPDPNIRIRCITYFSPK